jgi:hypothetical protein
MRDDALQKAAIEEEKRKAEAIPEEEEEEVVKQSFFITEPLPLPKPSSVRYQPPTPHWQIAKEKAVKPPSEIQEQPQTKPAPKSLSTKTKTIIPEEKKDELDWDAYLLSKLDKHIATRLVHEFNYLFLLLFRDGFSFSFFFLNSSFLKSIITHLFSFFHNFSS